MARRSSASAPSVTSRSGRSAWTAHDIAAGHVTLLVGGANEDVDRARPVLNAYGDPVLHVGPLGAGQGVKLVNSVRRS